MVEPTPINTSGQTTPTPEKTPVPKKTHPIKTFFKRVLLFFVSVFILICIGTYVYFSFTYREGDSAGILVSFTKEGYVFKTYEGLLNLGSVSSTGGSSTANNTWAFTVKDEKVAKSLSDLQGKTVKLHYKEKKGNFFWQGETNKFVDKAEEVK